MKRTMFARIFAFSALFAAVSCGGGANLWDVEEFSGNQLYGRDLPDKTVTLTFDDGPGGRTLELGSYLAEQGIPATFFVLGSAAARSPSALRTLAAQGHLIGNHSWSHKAFTQIQTQVSEVSQTDDVIREHVANRVFVFRAPYGDWAPYVAGILNATSLKKYVGGVFWDIGGQLTTRYGADWACWSQGLSADTCGQRYLNEIEDRRRGIVLAHDIHSKTVDMVKWLVPRLKERGFRFVRLDAVPNIADKIRAAGGTPGGVTPEPLPIGKIACPEGFTLESVGSAGGALCVNNEHAIGPFTQKMVDKCLGWGGGDACRSDRWAVRLAKSARGVGLCPDGASYDSLTTYCVEGANAFGPFPAELVDACEAAGGGESCQSARWNRDFLARLQSRL